MHRNQAAAMSLIPPDPVGDPASMMTMAIPPAAAAAAADAEGDVGGAVKRIAQMAYAVREAARARMARGVPLEVARCDACGSENFYPSVAVRLAYRRCVVCNREMLAPFQFLRYLPELPEARRRIKVVQAMYGHIGDAKRRVNVLGVVQAKADDTGGRYLCIGINEDLKALFGDPCPGIPKVLKLGIQMYERVYESEWEEQDGHMRHPLRIVSEEHDGSGEMSEDAQRITLLVMVIGHASIPLDAVDVTHIGRRLLSAAGDKALIISADENLALTFPDPAPGQPKVLFVRYSIFHRLGYMAIPIVSNGAVFRLSRHLHLVAAATRPLLYIPAALFGHPSHTQRAYDITDIVQARIDEAGGNWLEMLPEEDLHDWLGDPYTGAMKTLRIHYDMAAKVGTVAVRERHGVLEKPICVVAPVVAPVITIRSAVFQPGTHFWGQMPPPPIDVAPLLRKVVDSYGGSKLLLGKERDVRDIIGLNLAYLDKVRGIDSAAEAAKSAGPSLPKLSSRRSIRVSDAADQSARSHESSDSGSVMMMGGHSFRKRPDGSWIAVTTSRPSSAMSRGPASRPSSASSAQPAALEAGTPPSSPPPAAAGRASADGFRPSSAARGAARLALAPIADEETPRGDVAGAAVAAPVPAGPTTPAGTNSTVAPRGVAKECTHKLTIQYVDRGRPGKATIEATEQEGVAIVNEAYRLVADMPEQGMRVLGGVYGHPTDASKRVDICGRLQRRVTWHPTGARLEISTSDKLDDAFGNPCPGVFKVLVMRYTTMPYAGCYEMIVPGPGTPLGVHVRIGWQPNLATH